jgi:uncharacterized membrane protein YraQ (UPF0718 family)
MDIFYFVQIFADWMTHAVLGLPYQSVIGDALVFFIYDSIKIFILLYVIISTVSVIRTYIAPEKVKRLLVRRGKLTGHVMAAGLGIITPFCSCSAVPLFLGFVEAGVPLGMTFSFLVASPMINEVALAMLWGTFGLRIALLYVLSGMVIAVLAGLIIGRMDVEHLLELSAAGEDRGQAVGTLKISLKRRLRYGHRYALDLMQKIWIYVIIGIGIGAWIHGYAPAELLANYAGKDRWYAVPLATLIGIPLYSNAAGIMPIVSSLFEKGVGLGTALAFMMATTGLSLPEFLILRKVMKTRLILIFAFVVGAGIIFTGYLFNIFS